MSKHGKKLQRIADHEGILPRISVEMGDGPDDLWLSWDYQGNMVRVEIPLTGEDRTPWLYVDGNDSLLDNEAAQASAEAQFGAMTRVRLMESYRDTIVMEQAGGLALLRAVATTQGMFGQRERRLTKLKTAVTTKEGRP